MKLSIRDMLQIAAMIICLTSTYSSYQSYLSIKATAAASARLAAKCRGGMEIAGDHGWLDSLNGRFTKTNGPASYAQPGR